MPLSQLDEVAATPCLAAWHTGTAIDLGTTVVGPDGLTIRYDAP